MRKCLKIFILFFVFTYSNVVFATELSINDIYTNFGQYQNKEIELILRLKSYDRQFMTISFYDENNQDLVFYIDEKKFQQNLKNIVLGLRYRVKLKITGKGSEMRIYGELLEFSPLMLEKIGSVGK